MARLNWLGGLVLTLALACSSTTTHGSQSNSSSSGTNGGGGKLSAGTQCIANADCASGVCGVNGTGACCSHACSTGDSVCGATDCDSSGSCSYPAATTSCGRCSDGTLTPGTCDGLGLCANPTTAGPCPLHMGCNAAGNGCNTTCATTADCASGSYCSSGACVAQIATGACDENDACTSGICGVIGTGHCCTAGCANIAAPCGATDCDDSTGACTFADVSTTCGPAPTCNANLLNAPGNCDGHGSCLTTTTECTPYICSTGTCLTSCADSSSCQAGNFCDLATSACCTGLTAGGIINVDGLSGIDTNPCCGIDENAPCLTVSRAMKLIDSVGAENVTISLTLGGGNLPPNGNWAPAGEVYPIVLGWGAELLAPGISFADPAAGILYNDAGVRSDAGTAHGEIFDVRAYSAADTLGYASIAGTPGFPVSVGIATTGGYRPNPSSIQVEANNTLYLANANVNGDANGSTTAIKVLKSATLMLGQDRAGQQVGQVNIGQAGGGIKKGVYSNDGWIGIDCQGCTVLDSPALAGATSVVIQGQIFDDIQANDGSNITLKSAPIIGASPGSASFNTCGSKQDAIAGNGAGGVLLTGSVTLTYQNGHVQCIAGDGFELAASAAGSPTVYIDNTTIQNTEAAVVASAGSATISNSLLQFNYNGVEQLTVGANSGTIDLSGSGLGGTNTIVCSSSIESIHGTGGVPGVDVLNETSGTLNASHVAWDTSGPDLFSCASGLTSCTCQSGTCANPGGVDGMDAVYTAGSVTTTGNTLSSISCLPVCFGAPPCAPGTTCCSTSAFSTKSICLGPGKGCL